MMKDEKQSDDQGSENAWTPSAAERLVEHRLYRTHYFVLPRLAIQVMPDDWKARLEALLCEADAKGLETPRYLVLRDEREYSRSVPEDEMDPEGPVDRIDVFRPDPWADYRRGDVSVLCPGFDAALMPRVVSAAVASLGEALGETQVDFPRTAERQTSGSPGREPCADDGEM